jgi:hypothetical protein
VTEESKDNKQHPWYGECDRLGPNDKCAECLKCRRVEELPKNLFAIDGHVFEVGEDAIYISNSRKEKITEEEEYIFSDLEDCHIVIKNKHVEGGVTFKTLYQAFKSRLMNECSLVPRMTPEEYEEWASKMVIKR